MLLLKAGAGDPFLALSFGYPGPPSSLRGGRLTSELGNETRTSVEDRNPGFERKQSHMTASCAVKWMEPPRLTDREIKGRCGVWV